VKIESTAFTMTEVQSFLDEMHEHDRQLLADRLEQASGRLAALGPRVKPGAGEGGWSAHEILAHITVLSKFYGVMVHRISSGQTSELALLEAANQRDVAGDRMSQLQPPDLVRMALADHERTIKILRNAELASLKRSAQTDGGSSMTAEEVARLPLLNHLEMHLDQLASALED
jgi:hypothetical protein